MNALAQMRVSREPGTALVEAPRPAGPEPRADRIDLPEAALRQAEERYKVISSLVEFMKLPRARRAVRTQDGGRLTTPGALVEYLATQTFQLQTKTHGLILKRVSAPTIWRWYRRHRKAERERQNGKLGLARPVRSDKGMSRVFARNPKAAA